MGFSEGNRVIPDQSNDAQEHLTYIKKKVHPHFSKTTTNTNGGAEAVVLNTWD